MKNYMIDNRFRLTMALAIGVSIVLAFAFGVLTPEHSAMAGVLFGLNTTAFPVNPQLTAIAIGYKNPDVALIADQVLPRFPTAKKFNYTVYNTSQGYTVPNTKVGRKSEPTMADFGGTSVPNEVVDYGLDDLLPVDEIQAFDDMPKPASGGPIDPQALSAMMLTGLIELDREVRVAATVFNANNYVAGNQQTLAGTSQWSDYANSNPLSDLLAALDATLIRPNKLILGQHVWTVLRQNPKIVNAFYHTPQNSGSIPKEGLAELLEIDEVIIGAGFVNVARKGQTPNYQRVWGKHASLIYSSLTAAQTAQPCYGFTAQWGTRIAGALSEPKSGLRGGVRIRVGESVQEVISAIDAGYFFQNAVA
ncbi:MAG: phage capsid protein [Sulfuriferula sp.]